MNILNSNKFFNHETKQIAISYYGCKLGGTFNLQDGTEVRRVPGGWIHTMTNSGIKSSIFVPFSEEFKQLAEGN